MNGSFFKVKPCSGNWPEFSKPSPADTRIRSRLDLSIGYAKKWLSQDPLLEEPHRMLMLLYASAGQRNAALRQYRECVRILDQELGVTPLEETTRIYQDILENRLQAAKTPLLSDQSAVIVLNPQQAERKTLRPPALIGRREEWEQLVAAWRKSSWTSQVVILSGEAGIGKTRLAEEFLASLRELDVTAIHARCYDGQENLAYAPLLDALNHAIQQERLQARLASLPVYWLAEAAQLVPSLAGASLTPLPQSTLSGPGAQTRLFESICQLFFALLAGQPAGVVFFDDLQWADAATLDFLEYLLPRSSQSGYMVILSWRDESIPPVDRLVKTAAQLSRENRAIRLTLSRFSASEVAALIQAAGLPDDRKRLLEARLYAESEGLPFFAVEYLKVVDTASPSASSTWSLPDGVRDLLHTRLASAGETAAQLLAAAAVLGQSFDFELLRECSGRSEIEVIEGIERLLNLGLVRESAAAPSKLMYDFSHEKLRTLAYEETSQARRRLLHRRAAEILERQNNEAAAGLIASHYENAGLALQAANYYKHAGDYAGRVFANQDALAHYRAALACGHPDPGLIHQAIGDLQVLQGEYRAAISSYETAAALCNPGCLTDLEYKLGVVADRLGEWDLAESHLQAALDSLPETGAAEQHAKVLSELSMNAFHRNQPQAAIDLGKQASELAENSSDRQALAQALNLLGIFSREAGSLDDARAYLERSLMISEELAHPAMQSAALNNLALVLRDAGEFDQAIELTRRALVLCRRLGDRHREAALHNNLADLLHATGLEEEAMLELKQAVVLFAEVGLEAGGAQTEIWKLVEW